MGGFRLGSVKFLYLPAVYYLFVRAAWIKKFFIVFKGERSIFFLAFIYVLLRTFIGGEVIFIWEIIVSFVEVMLIPCCLMLYMSQLGFGGKDMIIKNILIVGAVGTLITMLCLTIPPINSFVRDSIMHITSGMRAFDHSFRGFGISESLSSQYGYIQGIMVAFGAFFFKKNKWFALYIPFALLSAFVNARTGVIVAVSGVIIYLLYNRNYLYSLLLIGVTFLFVTYFDAILKIVVPNSETRMWISDFIMQIDAIMVGGIEDSRQTEFIFEQMIILPETLEQWIIGRGFNLGANDMFFVNSDVGFIQQLNYGGVIYMIVLLSFVFYTFSRLIKSKNRLYGVFFLLVFLVLNIKTHYILNSGSFRLMMLVYYVFILDAANNLRCKKKHKFYAGTLL